jgi:peptidoglycan/xylan/chitin deacetylase (PgdA/CDA1 family)
MFKRILVLAAGVLLFIAAFIIFFDISRKEMEDNFKAERMKFGVEGVVLTSATPPTTPTTTPSPVNADGNNLIGPVPPPTSPSTPATDSSTAPATPATESSMAPAAPAPDSTPAPAAPDTNAAPAPSTPPSSTLNDRRENQSPFFQLTAYHPDAEAPIELAQALPGATVQTVTAPASAPAPAAPAAAPELAPTTAPKSEAAGEGSVIVLLYHQFKPAGVAIPAKFQWTMNVDVFAYEMKYIHDNGYNVISMDQLIKFIKHEGTVPPRAVCITIDDGYKSAVVYAAPILKQYNYPWTFFIYPDFVTVAEGSGAVSWNDLLELQKEGVDIESHSMTHPNLKLHKQKVKGVWHDFTPDEYAAWLNNETAGSKALLEQHMGKPITRFAYPYGEYNKQVEDAAIAAGYEAIFTVADNPVHATTSLHSIGRYTITQGVEKNFAAYLRQGALGLSSADPAPGATITNPRPVITAVLGYAGTLDPKSIETSVRDFGDVKHDFDPATNTIRLYLPRDLIQPVVLVNIRVQDAATKQVMVANWHFNYESPTGAAASAAHAPIAPPEPSPAPVATAPAPAPAMTNAPPVVPEPLEKAPGTPLDAHPATTPAPVGQRSPD